MLTRLLISLLCLTLLAPVAEAQKAKTDPRIFEVETILSESRYGFAITEAVLSNSFAAHLHGRKAPVDAAALSALYVAYDPTSGTRLTPGLLYYHFARPLDLLGQIGGAQNMAFLRVFQVRLLMLAGQSERALDLATQTITEMDASGAWREAQMTSLLADAAVLLHRAGNPDQAKIYFDRALSCGELRCPQDLVFRWLGPNRNAYYTPELRPAQDQARLDHALVQAEAFFGDDTSISDDIRLEFTLITRDGDTSLYDIAERVKSGTPLSLADQRRARLAADRITTQFELLAFNMEGDSAAGAFLLAISAGDDPEAIDLSDPIYLPTDSYKDKRFIQTGPTVLALLAQSDRPGDRVVSDLIRARLILQNGDVSQGIAALQNLIAKAGNDGFSDAQLFSPLIDLWAIATLQGDTALVEQALARTTPCRITLCPEDLVLRYFAGTQALPKPITSVLGSDWTLAFSTAFVEETLSGDRMILADLYPISFSQTHPMDAADQAELSMSYAESAVNPNPADLVERAESAMNVLVYAGRYDAAVAMGDRIAARVPDTALTGRFFQIRARAAHRIDDPRAEAFYSKTVEINPWLYDLAEDLLETPFLDVLEAALDTGVDWPDIRARLLYRQGRFAEAADVLAADRLADEAKSEEADPYATELWLKMAAFQEAHYREAAGQTEEAARLRDIGARPAWFHQDWVPLPDTPRTQTRIDYGLNSLKNSYSQLSYLFNYRDRGNYEAAAEYMKTERDIALLADGNGTYLDAQTLWQMAFTFVRAGETEIAFDLMNRAARIAATLSFEGAGGAGGGTLQLLERDRWRYLLFVDIAWAALSGQSPEDMLVVSRY
jgi:hypothetical protein